MSTAVTTPLSKANISKCVRLSTNTCLHFAPLLPLMDMACLTRLRTRICCSLEEFIPLPLVAQVACRVLRRFPDLTPRPKPQTSLREQADARQLLR